MKTNLIQPRELSFRVWSPSKNKWLKESSHYTDDYSFSLINKPLKVCKRSSGEFLYYCDDVIIQQFTGLYDSKNARIYEGDILKVRGYGDWLDDENIKYYYNTIVVFCAGGFKTKSIRALKQEAENQHDKYIGNDLFYHVTEGCEIVGNIFENEELLND